MGSVRSYELDRVRMAGFRGAVSLAIALSVPTALADGGLFPARDDIVLVTAGVVVLTLLVQGPLLPGIVRWAHLGEDDADADELRLAEQEITATAVAALPDLAAEHAVSEEVRQRLTSDYQEHLALVRAKRPHSNRSFDPAVEELEALLQGQDIVPGAQREARVVQLDEYGPLTRNEEYTRLRLALLDRKRETLLRLRREGTIDDAVSWRIQTRLDIEELRLTGIEPFA